MNSQYKELTDKAFSYHQNGDINMAEKIYRTLLNVNPDDANILNLMGLLHIAKGQTKEAVDYLTKAFIINRSAPVASNLAKAYYTLDEPEKAIKLYLEALKDEETDDIYYSLGIAYKKIGDISSSIEAYHNALDKNPDNYSACYNLALAYIDNGDNERALSFARRCLFLKDDDESLYGILSSLYEKFGDYEEAVKSLEKAISLNPDNYVYYYNAAVLSGMVRDYDKSIYYYLKTIEKNPNHIESYVNLANAIKKNDSNKAIEYLIKAYKINPKEENLLLSLAQSYKDIYKNDESIKILNELLNNNPLNSEAYSQMAMNYMDLCQYEKALKYYDLALKIKPDNLNFQHGRAVALKYLGRIEECQKILEDIVKNKNASLETKITLGMLYLQDKKFKKGMELYRLRSNNIKSKDINKEDIWEIGDSVKNKTILVYSNCGLGDSIMYSRYLPLLKEKAKDIILQTDENIVSIMQESFPMISVIKKDVKPDKYDKVLQFMDIQLALDFDFSNIPCSEGYLKINEDLVNMFSKLPIFKSRKKKIGLYWQGNRRIFKNRSIKFDILNRLTQNKKYNFYSFQIDENIEETENLFDLSKHIKDYSDTAALLKNIDIMITIDSSIAHMSGALGVKTFLLLPKTAEWRWFNDEETTPWYDSVTIFKQNKSADWDEVIDRVSSVL